MAAIGAILSVASGVVGAMGTIAQAKANVAAAQAEQVQLGQMAAERRAVASRDAQAKSKEKDTLLSRGQAVAADSGGGATDPTVMELAGDIAKQGSVQSRELFRQGAEEGRMLQYKGQLGVSTAKASQRMAYLGAAGQVLGGFTSAFQNYGQGLPSYANLGATSWYGAS